MKTKLNIAIGDIVKLKTVSEYEEAGDEVTELVERFAGQYGKVINVDEDVNEWGEGTYEVYIQFKGFVSVTDHEIAELYKKVEL